MFTLNAEQKKLARHERAERLIYLIWAAETPDSEQRRLRSELSSIFLDVDGLTPKEGYDV
jgi:hypothetical protein